MRALVMTLAWFAGGLMLTGLTVDLLKRSATARSATEAYARASSDLQTASLVRPGGNDRLRPKSR